MLELANLCVCNTSSSMYRSGELNKANKITSAVAVAGPTCELSSSVDNSENRNSRNTTSIEDAALGVPMNIVNRNSKTYLRSGVSIAR